MLRVVSFSLCALLALSVPAKAHASAAEMLERKPALQLMRITPNGDNTSEKRQIVLTFNRPVVPLGDMTRKAEDIAVKIEPALDCQWRWLNRTALSCQLNQQHQMTDATAYLVTVSPDFADHEGISLGKEIKHHFTTTRPKVRAAYITNWETEKKPYIKLRFNQYVTKESVAQAIQLVPANPFTTTKETYIHPMDVTADPDDKRDPKWVMGSAQEQTYQWADLIQIRKKGSAEKTEKHEARKIWIVSPQEELRADTKYHLKTSPGLVSADGSAPSIETRKILNFATFPEFSFLGVSCYDNQSRQIHITPEDVESHTKKCNPMNSASLRFSAPVAASQVKKYMEITPDLAGGRKDFDPWANAYELKHKRFHHRQESIYYVHMPIGLQAAEDYHLKADAVQENWQDRLQKWWDGSGTTSLSDVFGRPLTQAIDFQFSTNHRPPNYEILHNTSVLETSVPSDIPLYVTNMEAAKLSYRQMTADGKISEGAYEVQDIHQAQDVQYATPLGLRDLADDQGSILYGHVETVPVLTKHDQAGRIFNITTPFLVHAKLGHFNSQIWVTDLTTGDIVKDAKVEIYHSSLSDLSVDGEVLEQSKTNAFGIAKMKGRIDLDPELKMQRWCNADSQDDCTRLFLRVTSEGRMAILPLIYDFQLNTYRLSKYQVYPQNRKAYGHVHSWGMTAQGIYRRGDQMDFKIYMRDQNVQGYIPPMRDGYHLELYDPMENKVWEKENISLNDFGTFSDHYLIPEQAPIGWYRLEISHPDLPDQLSMVVMRVLVSDFTPSPFKVENTLNGQTFTHKADVTVDSYAKLHSGGPYSQAGSRVKAWLEKRSFTSKDPAAKGFYFGDMGAGRQQIFQKQDKTNAKGEVTHHFTLPKTSILHGRLMVETAIRDDRGKYIASQTSATYIGRDRYVGLKQTKWLYEAGKVADIKYLVTDASGALVADHDVAMHFQYLENKMAKVKGAGNAYLSKYTSTWIDVGQCQGKTKAEAATCSFTPEKAGRYKAIATIKDSKGRTQQSETQLWVTGAGYVTWQQPNDHSLEIVPEQESYKVGDTARYLVKNPYPDAQAWVSIERYGILKSYSQKLEGSTPVISFEVTEDMVPGYYLSVTVMAPRVAGALPEMGQVDLAKPVFKTGYIKQKVTDETKKLDVAIRLEQETYKPRDIVSGQIKVTHKTQEIDRKNPVNIALVVLDEAVLDLVQGREAHFDPYQGFYGLDALDVQNFNILTRLVGLQKFEKKGANPGGDGGVDLQEMQMRNLFKYVAHWQPNLPMNSDGTADFSFTLPDNLTGWRVLAIAVDQDDLMGLGQHSFKTNKPTEIRPAMPNQVQEGDQFTAAFTIMNRSEKTRDITVEVKATGDIEAEVTQVETYQIAPYQRQKMTMNITAAKLPWQRDLKNGQITFEIKAYDDLDTDMTLHHLNTYKNRTTDVAAIYGTAKAADKVVEDIAFPSDIYPDAGYLSVGVSPSVIGNIAGAFSYMRDYPYPCWEQKLSRAAMGGYYQKLQAYLPADLTWEGAETLPQEILNQASKYQAPNGGMTYFVAKNNYVSPYLSAYTALAFNWLRDMGYHIPADVEGKLHTYLKKYLRKAPDEDYLGHASTVRAVILAALANHENGITLDDIKRYASSMPQMTLFGQAHYLQAALKTGAVDGLSKKTFDHLLKYSHQSSGKFIFQEELDDGYDNLLVSGLRANCAILSSMVAYDQLAEQKEDASDIAMKLTRMITQERGGRDHFENTQENIFCLRALLDYAQKYEAVIPHMTVAANLSLGANETVTEIGKVTLSDHQSKAAPMIENITEDHIGQDGKLTLTAQGQGRYYYQATMAYARTDDASERINAGMGVRKEYSVETIDGWQIIGADDVIKTGDLVRVDLYLSLPAARHFVVVDDPVPGGVEPVNRDLATTSKTDADKGAFKAADGSFYYQYDDWQYGGYQSWHFYHQELRHDAARFYADYLPAGNYHLSYMVQAIAAGQFKKQPVKAAEMYDADIYGLGRSGQLHIMDGAP